MTVSTSLLAYTDCIAFMESALEDDLGARQEVTDADAAVQLRTRIHYARKLHRDENAKSYEPGHMMHGRSEFDKLICRIKHEGEKTYVYLEKIDKPQGKVEGLSQVKPLIEAASAPRQITYKDQGLDKHVEDAPRMSVTRRV